MSSNIKISPIISTCHAQLNRIGKITPKSMNRISEKAKQTIRDCTPARLKELAQMNCFAAEKVKAELDKKYGENNYVIIAIGRSISSIAETLGHIGVDTKIIPLSGLRWCDIDFVSIQDLPIYRTFLESKGLGRHDLDMNKNKKYIIMDYAYYGRSLERTERLLRKEELMGDAPNLISLKINDVLGEDFNKFQTLFRYNRFKAFSYVGKLKIDNLKDVFKQCSPDRVKEFKGNITQGLRKLFWFNVFDSLKQKNYKNIIPIKEFEALQEHQMSRRAIQNYISRLQNKANNLTKN